MKPSEAKEVAFLGRITAGVTHEIKNVLAIIRESSGLMEDFLSLMKPDTFPHQDKFSGALSTIQNQVNRGVELSGRLNRFAHSPDERSARVDLNEVVEQVVFLSQRFARLKKVSLLVSPFDQSEFVVTDPVRFQMAVFFCLESCWGLVPPGGEVHIGPGRSGRQSMVRTLCQGDAMDRAEFGHAIVKSEAWSEVLQIAEQLGLTVEKDDAQFSVLLIFPDQ